MEFISLIWLFLFLFALIPFFRQKQLIAARLSLIRNLEKERQSRVITLIHRQEALSFLGIPFRRFIDLEDSEQVLRAIRLTSDNTPIDIILHTPGGIVLAAEQIARALKKHPARGTAMVPHYAMSGGTMICLAADEILMDDNAVLGPIDPQIGQFPASSIKRVLKDKRLDKIDDETLILADIAEKASNQVYHSAVDILSTYMPQDEAENLAQALSEGRWTHDYALVCSTLSLMGLPIKCELPETVYRLMALFPQPTRQIPTVEYIPIPYRR